MLGARVISGRLLVVGHSGARWISAGRPRLFQGTIVASAVKGKSATASGSKVSEEKAAKHSEDLIRKWLKGKRPITEDEKEEDANEEKVRELASYRSIDRFDKFLKEFPIGDERASEDPESSDDVMDTVDSLLASPEESENQDKDGEKVEWDDEIFGARRGKTLFPQLHGSEFTAEQIAGFLEARRALDVAIIDVSKKSPFAKHFVLATSRTRDHHRNVVRDIRRLYRKNDLETHFEGSPESEWSVIDTGSMFIHVMSEHSREFFDLEELWSKDEANITKLLPEKQESGDEGEAGKNLAIEENSPGK